MPRPPKYLRAWKDSGASEARVASAAQLIRFAFRAPEVLDRHRLRLLKDMTWDLTEADGKYETRYRSSGTLNLGLRVGWEKHLQHEHVIPRQRLIEAIYAPGGLDDGILESTLHSATACIVTRDEHRRLKPFDRDLEGWDRYRAAGVTVYDMAFDPPRMFIQGEDRVREGYLGAGSDAG